VALEATGIGSTSFTANWEAFPGAVVYLLDVSETSDFSTFVYENQEVNAPSTSYVVIGLNPNTTYYYRVRASTEALYDYLLDDYSGAAAAYSLRLLRAAYTGDAIEVRRSSDNTTQDIGFVNNELDTTSLLSFVGTGGTDNGFVTTWYDQSGNGYDATQTTAASQPQIVSGGSVKTVNGEPALDFDGTDDYLSNASSLSYSGGVSWYSVQNLISGSQKRLWCDDITGVQGYTNFYSFTNGYNFNDNGGGYKNFVPSGWLVQQQLASLNFDDSNGNYNYAFDGSNTSGTINGWTGPLGTSGSANIGIMGAGNGTQCGEGKLQELVIYPNNQSSNRTGIETNINNHYSIFQ
jgi:hypothetical protein